MIKKIKLKYDVKYIEFEIPEENIACYSDFKQPEKIASNHTILNETVNKKSVTESIHVLKEKKVALLIEDSTRDVPNEDKLDFILPHLNNIQSLLVIIATGTHHSDTPENNAVKLMVEKKADQHNIKLKQVLIHDCYNQNYYYTGTTDSQNDIWVNDIVSGIDAFVVFSDIKNHYFAGYSNPLKQFLPGICKFETIERNHALALKNNSTFGQHPLHYDKNRQNNPLAQDMLQAFKLIVNQRLVFVFATLSVQKRILWSTFGNLEEVSSDAFRQADKLMSIKVKKSDYIIVSSGGYPNDESLYHAQKALELSRNGLKQNGEILFIAGCQKGIGSEKSVENFYLPLRQEVDEIILQTNRQYKMFSHKSYKFAQLIKNTKAIYMYTGLDKNTVESIHLYKTSDVQNIVDSWLKTNKDASVNIFAEGNKVAVYS